MTAGEAPTGARRGAGKPLVLLVGEAVTLAHAVRPFVLAGALDRDRYDVVFACDPRYDALLVDPRLRRVPIASIPAARFIDAAARARLAHGERDFRAYVEEELDLIRRLRPRLVVGDFRHSLAVSAPASGVPYANLCNAYWSPHAQARFEIAAHPLEPLLGMRFIQRSFELVRPLALGFYARPLNRLRRERGLPPIAGGLPGLFTAGDHALFADAAELVPTPGAPATHRYLGPVPWSPQCESPAWWPEARAHGRIAFINLGSSGPVELLEAVAGAAREAGLEPVVATAGRAPSARVRAARWVADFLPGDEIARHAAVVVCNGGSPATYQSLAQGTPVLGIASNMDQMLNMGYVAAAGAGLRLRPREATGPAVREALRRIDGEAEFRAAAARLSGVLARYDAAARFRAFVDEQLAAGPTGT